MYRLGRIFAVFSAMVLASWPALAVEVMQPGVAGYTRGFDRTADTSDRVALVIGNAKYENVRPLDNTVNDADAVAMAVNRAGFKVFKAEDVNRSAMNDAIGRFLAAVNPGSEALIYYSGHGVELDGQNYLLPTDVRDLEANEQYALQDDAIGLNVLLSRLQARQARVSIVVLDACRTNPFTLRGQKALGGGAGLAATQAVEGTVVIYSASAGEAALDRIDANDTNPNGLFTRHLVPLLEQPGLEIHDLVRKLKADVYTAAIDGTGMAQRPSYYDGLIGDFYFIPPRPGTDTTAPAPVADPTPQVDSTQVAALEERAFQDAKELGTLGAFKAYIESYPNGFHAALAREYIAKLDEPVKVPEQPAKPAIDACDILASVPGDPSAVAPGIPSLKLDREGALTACAAAVAREPGNPRFAYLYGRVLDSTRRWDEAIAQYTRAAAAGYPEAKAEALLWPYRLNQPKDDTTRSKLIDQLETLGSEGSQNINFYKGMLLFNGSDSQRTLAHDIFAASAAKGYAAPMIYLGIESHLAGDYPAALSWFEKALNAGTPMAYNTLALMYDAGQGVAANPDKSAEYLLKFAKYQLPAADLGELIFMPSDAVIKALQRRMSDLGYYKGSIDGIAGPGTRAAYAAAGAID